MALHSDFDSDTRCAWRSWRTTAKEPKSVGSTRIRAPVQRTKLPGSEWLRIGKSSREGLMTRGGSGLKLFQWAPPGLHNAHSDTGMQGHRMRRSVGAAKPAHLSPGSSFRPRALLVGLKLSATENRRVGRCA